MKPPKPDPRATQRPIPLSTYPHTPAGLRALADDMAAAMPGPFPLGEWMREAAGAWAREMGHA